MDFVTAWKAASVVLAGAFGILGLLKEFKSKETGRVTKWGWVSLVGIILSSTLGVIAQLKESSRQEKSRQATANQTLALAQKTDRAVKDIQRILSPLEDPRFFFYWETSCGNYEFKGLCSATREGMVISDADLIKNWPGIDDKLRLNVDFIAAGESVEKAINGRQIESDLGLVVIASVKDSTLFVQHNGGYIQMRMIDSRASKTALDDAFYHIRPRATGRLKSLLDLPGTTMIVSSPVDQRIALDQLTLKAFSVTVKNNQEVIVWDQARFERITVKDKPAYRYVFPTSPSED